MPNSQVRVYQRDFFEVGSGGWPFLVMTVSHEGTLSQLHTHVFLELVIISEGSGTYADGRGNHYLLSPGKVFLLLPGMAHVYTSQNNLKLTNVLWDQSALEIPLHDLKNSPGYHALFEVEPCSRGQHLMKGTLTLDAGQLSQVMALLERMQQEQRQRLHGSQLMLISMFCELLTMLCRAYENSSQRAVQDMQSLDRAVLYVHQHYASAISREKLAQVAGLGESTFYRLFRRIMGISPVEYVINTRFSYAHKMLLETDCSLSDIALACGFTDSNYFGNRFRERYGISPNQYRKKMRQRGLA